MLTYDLQKAIRERRSVRTYDGIALTESERRQLMDYVNQIENPFGVAIRFRLLDHAGAEKDFHLDTKGVVTGTELYLAAVAPKDTPWNLEACGYSFELLVLYAASLGIGTTIIAGTMDRPAFEAAAGLTADELLPVMTPLGRPAKKQSLRERAMRRAIKADQRLPWDQLFFDGNRTASLNEAAVGPYREALEALRLAPSAVNQQPWIVIRDGGCFHFVEKHGRGFGKDPAGDIQRVDMGIAFCHFEQTARAQGLSGRWERQPVKLDLAENMDYIISWICE